MRSEELSKTRTLNLSHYTYKITEFLQQPSDRRYSGVIITKIKRLISEKFYDRNKALADSQQKESTQIGFAASK